MTSLEEVMVYMTGLWQLLLGDRRGLAYLDLSERGLTRSFQAILWCLPPILISWLWWYDAYRADLPPEAHISATFVLRLAMLEGFNWIVPLILAGAALWFVHLPERFPGVGAVINWISLPFAYIDSVRVLLSIFFPEAESAIAILWLLLILGLLIALYRVLKPVTDAPAPTVAGLVFLIVIPAMLMTSQIAIYLGLTLN